jgi:hypothetical protein
LDKTILDYVVVAIIPALIMCLVGSLVFFLLTVFYHGQYEARLHFIFAMFVLATVLIARISMEDGVEYAMLFALPLAVAAGLATLRFVEIQGPWKALTPLINFALLGIVWWSAHKLTWDCTLIDEQEDDAGEGLLQTIGLDEDRPTQDRPTEDRPTEGRSSKAPPAEGRGPNQAERPNAATAEAPAPRFSVWRLWRQWVENQRRPHAPGVWVVYFSLAALPIFGFGQRFIPASDLANRQYALRLLLVYVASGLGLLLTTSFLGLRRYLRQRRVEMSADMARTWLIIGSGMIVGLMVFCLLLPRPDAEYSVSRLPFQFGSPSGHRPSSHALGREGASDRQGPTASTGRGDQEVADAAAQPQPTRDASESGPPSKQQDEQGEVIEQADSTTTGRDQHKTAPDQDSSSTNRAATESRATSDTDQSAESPETSQSVSDEDAPPPPPERPPTERLEELDSTEPSRTDARRSQGTRAGRGDRQPQTRTDQLERSDQRPAGRPSDDSTNSSPQTAPTRSPPASSPGTVITNLGTSLAGILKLVFYAILLAVGACLAWKQRDRIKAAWLKFLDEIRHLWGRLFGGTSPEPEASDSESVRPSPTLRPFSDYADPFASGWAGHCSAAELIQYSFEALEAWARDHGRPRRLDQTPAEFARQIGQQQRDLAPHAWNLALLYSRAAYAQASLPVSTTEQLRQLWVQLLGEHTLR